MAHGDPRVATQMEDAAQILRGYRRRIEQLEEESTSDDNVQLYRQSNETVGCTDTITTSTSTAGFEWNTSKWNLDEWEDN